MKKLFNKKKETVDTELENEEVTTETEVEGVAPEKKNHKKLLIGVGIGTAVIGLAALMLGRKKDDVVESEWFEDPDEDSDDDEDSDEETKTTESEEPSEE